ncbi:MAG: alpha/beta fold hydrolase [Eubacteriales bacterium]|nr:alpha/beta fold hydrolase [Eubacteriales bacterium]
MEETWRGFACRHLVFEEQEAVVVCPKQEKANGFLAVKTEYWDAFPEAVELPLLEEGFHLCYIRNENRWGTDADLDRKARFLRWVQKEWGLQEKCVLVGMSCGGLIAMKLAARYPELVRCLYLDAPVVNYMSCPCGFGIGEPLGEDLTEILDALGMESVSELLAYRDMPLDHIGELVEQRIPVVMVAGDSDRTVPYCENGILVEKAYRNAGVEIEVFIEPGKDHHPHGMRKPERAAAFIKRQFE